MVCQGPVRLGTLGHGMGRKAKTPVRDGGGFFFHRVDAVSPSFRPGLWM